MRVCVCVCVCVFVCVCVCVCSSPCTFLGVQISRDCGSPHHAFPTEPAGSQEPLEHVPQLQAAVFGKVASHPLGRTLQVGILRCPLCWTLIVDRGKVKKKMSFCGRKLHL